MQSQQRRQPLERIQPTIPAEWYYDPGIFEREMDAIWTKEWLYIGRSEEVANRRDYKVVNIGDQRIVLVRDLEGRLEGVPQYVQAPGLDPVHAGQRQLRGGHGCLPVSRLDVFAGRQSDSDAAPA